MPVGAGGQRSPALTRLGCRWTALSSAHQIGMLGREVRRSAVCVGTSKMLLSPPALAHGHILQPNDCFLKVWPDTRPTTFLPLYVQRFHSTCPSGWFLRFLYPATGFSSLVAVLRVPPWTARTQKNPIQECLTQWLKHSNKSACELCKHSFKFRPGTNIPLLCLIPYCLQLKSTLVYAENTPRVLAGHELLVGLGKKVPTRFGL